MNGSKKFSVSALSAYQGDFSYCYAVSAVIDGVEGVALMGRVDGVCGLSTEKSHVSLKVFNAPQGATFRFYRLHGEEFGFIGESESGEFVDFNYFPDTAVKPKFEEPSPAFDACGCPFCGEYGAVVGTGHVAAGHQYVWAICLGCGARGPAQNMSQTNDSESVSVEKAKLAWCRRAEQ